MKIIVGLSGGVDSSVSAYLLKQQGYQVEALFMKNWQADDNDAYCTAAEDLADAEAVAAKLAIPLHTANFSQEYWDGVFTYFLDEYANGRTPNPDILCNKEIKFKTFLDHAERLGADKIATGHYARVKAMGDHYQLLKGVDPLKDQTYFLHQISQQALAKTLFPIGELEKSEVRDIARELNLITHDKKDSTGICFIGERKFKPFLKEFLLAKPGNILNTEGQVIGQHDGVMYYTEGQRQGLNIQAIKDPNSKPWYVVAKNAKTNELIVAQGANNPYLFSTALSCGPIHWIENKPPQMPLTCEARTRHRQAVQQCTITPINKQQNHVVFIAPQRAIAPGQYIVFYHNDVCLGGAVILQNK